MAISKTKNYLVLNESTSPVGIKTKHESYLVQGGTPESPGTLPLTFDEIAVVNSNSPAFKIGLLRFEPAYEADLYEELSITYWRDILTQRQIENILLHPTMEDLERVLAIENSAYFERVRGVLVGLKNAGADVSSKVDRMIEQRRRELSSGQRRTAIKLTPNNDKDERPTKEEFESMKAQLEAMQAMMAKMMSAASADAVEADIEKPVVKPTNKTKKNNGAK